MIMMQFACSSSKRALILSTLALLAGSTVVKAQAVGDTIKDHRTTEIYSPVPPVVTPAAKFGDAPSDAVILFNGKNLDEWVKVSDGTPADWIVSKDILTVNKNSGNIETKQEKSIKFDIASASPR